MTKVLCSLFLVAFFFTINLSAQEGKEAPVANAVAEEAEEDPVFIYNQLDKKPSFKGGNKELNNFLRINLQQVDSISGERLIGRSTIKFIVERTGELNIVGVISGLDEKCNRESVRLIKTMPNWEPGIYKEKPVRVYCTLQFYYE